jgi:hypothetical protein
MEWMPRSQYAVLRTLAAKLKFRRKRQSKIASPILPAR